MFLYTKKLRHHILHYCTLGLSSPWIEISVNTDVSVFEFYEYIRNISEIWMNIFT